jgi:hypothetical protein
MGGGETFDEFLLTAQVTAHSKRGRYFRWAPLVSRRSAATSASTSSWVL